MEKTFNTDESSKVPPAEARPDELVGQGFREAYTLHLADNALILGQRNAEWCGHGPVLEQDIAITNISLDLIGQARHFYQYAAEIINEISNLKDSSQVLPLGEDLGGAEATEDSLAYLRTEREFKNCLLLELPRGDWAQTILRQFFFSAYQFFLYAELQKSDDKQIAAIAEKSLKEVTYHLRWSSEWVIRLGDGTDESHQRMMIALDNLWAYTGELFEPAAYESISGIDFSILKEKWLQKVKEVFEEATISFPDGEGRDGAVYQHSGGKNGIHTEHMGFILSDLQYLQRTYPGAEW